jgi:sarcosine oxidase subunit gamma
VTELAERTAPLGDWSGRFAAASAAPECFSIREIPFAGQVNLRGNAVDPAFATAVRTATGCHLPPGANTWSGDPNCAALWLGPDEWLIVGPDGKSEDLCSRLRGGLTGMHHSVVDLSANRTIIEIAGADARTVLAKGCPLDLHSSVFGSGHCAQSLLAKSQVILQCMDARPALRIFVRISFAPYVAEWLLDASAELAASRSAGMLGLRL